ncbi:hypothetical protein CPB97_000188 [Podila verticillata]|nr:hypothetical protein CPB97_000188 [Podila verticillata]
MLIAQNRSLSKIAIRNKMSTKNLLTLAMSSPSSARELYLLMPALPDPSSDVEPQSLGGVHPTVAKFLLDHLPESMEEVYLHVEPEEEHEVEDPLDIWAGPSPSNHHALKSLEISGKIEGNVKFLMLPFLTTCGPNLQILRMPGIHSLLIDYKELLSLLGDGTMARLETHHFYEGVYATDQDIADMVSSSPHWTHIDISGCDSTGFSTAAAIADHCANLGALDLSVCDFLSSQDLQLILSKAEKLRVFEASRNLSESQASRSPSLSAQDLVETEWATSSLEVFRCPINVSRPDFHVPLKHHDSAWRSASLLACHELQRKTYRHLAQQTQLKEPAPGKGWNVDREDENCLWYGLELSLSSGLDELKDLKCLESLDVRLMNHNIGAMELEWMANNWPNLKHVYGICQRGKDRDLSMMHWLWNNSPMWNRQCDWY